jgi:hypothetical protein
MDRNEYKLRLLNVFNKISSPAPSETNIRMMDNDCISSKVSKGIIASIIKSNKSVLIELKGIE